MVSKAPLDENAVFLYHCIQSSGVEIDYNAVAAATNLTPAAARLRFSLIKAKIQPGQTSSRAVHTRAATTKTTDTTEECPTLKPRKRKTHQPNPVDRLGNEKSSKRGRRDMDISTTQQTGGEQIGVLTLFDDISSTSKSSGRGSNAENDTGLVENEEDIGVVDQDKSQNTARNLPDLPVYRGGHGFDGRAHPLRPTLIPPARAFATNRDPSTGGFASSPAPTKPNVEATRRDDDLLARVRAGMLPGSGPGYMSRSPDSGDMIPGASFEMIPEDALAWNYGHSLGLVDERNAADDRSSVGPDDSASMAGQN